MEVNHRPSLRPQHMATTTSVGSPSGSGSGNGSGSGSGSGSGALIDEISHQFLVCQICSENFKRPKTLRCLHTFCEECLEIRYAIEEQERPYRFLLSRSLSCPLCLAKTELPPGGVRRLPDNAVLTQLNDVIRRRKLSAGAQSCDICSAVTSSSRRSTSRATAKCVECSKMMCRKCVEIHRKTKVTREHCLFDIQVEKDVECKVHREEAIRFYCEQCQSCICVLCTFQDHSGHSISSFSEGIDRYSDGVRSLLVQARNRSQRLGTQLAVLNRCESSLRAADEAIRSTAIDVVCGVRRRERELLGQLRCLYGVEGTDGGLRSQRETIEDMVRSINATCELTDVLLEERSVEFLLVHKEIRDKLSSVVQSPLKELPEGLIDRNIRFRASSKNVIVEPIGCLHVEDSNSTGNKTDVDILEEDRSISNLIPLPMGECVERNCSENPASCYQLNLECLCDRKPAQTSSAESVDGFPSSSSSFSSFHLDQPLPSSRGRLRPPSPRGVPDLWPPHPHRRHHQTSVDLTDSETETVALVTDTKSTSTNSISTVDRSTLTTLRTTCDRTTSTDWLVTSRDQETFTSPPILLNESLQTDPPRVSSKCVQSHPETLNKRTMTRKPIQLERETNTPSVARFDCEVTARIIGDDKWTSTPVTFTSDLGVNCDLDSELEEIDRNFVHRRGNRRNWKRSFDPESLSSSSSSSSSLFFQTDRRTDAGLSGSGGGGGRFSSASTDLEDEGYDSRLKRISGEGVQENFIGGYTDQTDPTSDKELGELESYGNQGAVESSSSSTGNSIYWRDSTSSSYSSVPSSRSSSSLMLHSSSSSRRVSPASSSIADDLCHSAAESTQSFSTPSFASLSRLDLLSTSFPEELSTLPEENDDDDEELEDLKASPQLEKSIIASNQRNVGSFNSKTKPFDLTDSVEKEDAEDLLKKRIQADDVDGDRNERESSAIYSDDNSKRSSDETGTIGTAGQQLEGRGEGGERGGGVREGEERGGGGGGEERGEGGGGGGEGEGGVSHSSGDVSDAFIISRTGESKSENSKSSETAVDDRSRSSDATLKLHSSSRLKDEEMHDGRTAADEVVQVETKSMESKTSEQSSIDISADILLKDQMSHFSKTPKDRSRNTETSRTVDTVEKFDETGSLPKSSKKKIVLSPEMDLSQETPSRRRLNLTDEAEPDTTQIDVLSSSETERMVKPDLISETPPIHFPSRSKMSSVADAGTPGSSSLSGVQMENVYNQLEQLLPDIRALATSLSSSSHSSLVHLLLNICSVLVKEGRPNIRPLNDGSKPSLNSSSGSITGSSLHRPTIGSVLVDRALSPIRTLTRDTETSTHIGQVTQGSNTESALRVDIGVQSKHSSSTSSTCDQETSTKRTIQLEKETSTPHVHLLHKWTATDNQTTVDNQTTMTSDVRAAYLDAISPPRLPWTFSRGTCTPRGPTVSDRASSPIRFSCVDKAVLATKADALDPVDRFPGLGKSNKGARKPFVSSRKAKLECISEGAIEEEAEEEKEEEECLPSTLSSFRLKMVQRLQTTISSSVHQRPLPSFPLPSFPSLKSSSSSSSSSSSFSFSFAKRNNSKRLSLPVSPRPTKSFESSAFSFDVVETKEEEKEMMEELETEETFDVS